jgi:hypothetical protein
MFPADAACLYIRGLLCVKGKIWVTELSFEGKLFIVGNGDWLSWPLNPGDPF